MLGKTTKGQAQQAQAPGPRSESISVISSEMHVTGELESRGAVRIEGRVSGSVTADGVEVLSSGSVEGDVVAGGGGDATRPFVIDGRVAGRVRATVVRVGPGGTVEGGIQADEAAIQGRVSGGVVARRRLTLEKTAKVEGDVYARRLALQEGGMVNGTIRMGDQVVSGASEDAVGQEKEPERARKSVA